MLCASQSLLSSALSSVRFGQWSLISIDATDQHHAIAFDQQLLHAPCLHRNLTLCLWLAFTRFTWFRLARELLGDVSQQLSNSGQQLWRWHVSTVVPDWSTCRTRSTDPCSNLWRLSPVWSPRVLVHVVRNTRATVPLVLGATHLCRSVSLLLTR